MKYIEEIIKKIITKKEGSIEILDKVMSSQGFNGRKNFSYNVRITGMGWELEALSVSAELYQFLENN